MLKTSLVKESFFVAVSFGGSLYVGQRQITPLSDDNASTFKLLVTLQSSFNINVLEFSPFGQYLAVCGDDKHLMIWKVEDLTLLFEKNLPKRVTALVFSDDEKFVITADKAGEVTRYTVDGLQSTDSLLLGHSSMLLDMKLLHHPVNNESYLVTGDRDEKIRVSHYPNGYNIQSYCLGHTDFISRLCVCPQYPQLLISGSADNTVRVWHWHIGQLLHTMTVVNDTSFDKDDLPVISTLSCSSKGIPPLVATTTNVSNTVFLYQLNENGSLTRYHIIDCDVTPFSCTFDAYNRLWISCENDLAPIKCYNISENKIKAIDNIQEPLLTELNNKDISKNSVGQWNWSVLRKHDFDNMSTYLAKKDERIKAKKIKLDPSLESSESEDQPLPLIHQ